MQGYRVGASAIRVGVITGVLGLAGLWLMPERAVAEERKFAVMLAHSPKSFPNADGTPGLPPGGLEAVEPIRQAYFDRTAGNGILSFAEYWEEISYGDVRISGDAFGWITLPWAFAPTTPDSTVVRPSPEDFINLYREIGFLTAEPIDEVVRRGYAYGAGEEFCDEVALGGPEVTVDTDTCGELIIRDLRGNNNNLPDPVRVAGMVDKFFLPDGREIHVNVWTPGERFLDIDGDMRWDGLDELNDMMCHGPNGCKNICSISRTSCPSGRDGDCPPGETCIDDPRTCNVSGRPCPVGNECSRDEECIGVGPQGCNEPGCGDLAVVTFVCDAGPPPAFRAASCDWDQDGLFNNCSDDCRVITDADDIGTNCIKPSPPDGCSLSLPECCTGTDDPPDCGDDPGIDCGDPIFCCEFQDADGDGEWIIPEPFEDFVIRWNPHGATPASVWVPVTKAYIRNNYPGDLVAMLRRTGNGCYNPPDVFFDVRDVDDNNIQISTKMMQDAGGSSLVHYVPEPGSSTDQFAPTNGFSTEEDWFPQFWTDRYDSPVPVWPGAGSEARNSPRMRPFDPEVPVPPTVIVADPQQQDDVRIWFAPTRGGVDGRGNGTAENPDARTFGDDLEFQVLPEEEFGFYDGWVEHDDLPSSKYHSEGDKRLGEITSPGFDNSRFSDGSEDDVLLTAIWGRDLGLHDPNSTGGGDGWVPAAGPYAVNIHGEKGFDAGDVLILEWLTWRTDGNSPTIAYQWEVDNTNEGEGGDPYHPFAGPLRCGGSPSGKPCKTNTDCSGSTCDAWSLGLGFRDYNLDGMIDQGEVRPERSENYIVDSDPFTPNNGIGSIYPFNRVRMLEDIVEALDPSIDWDDFVDPNAKAALECSHGTTLNHHVNDPPNPNDSGHRKVIEPQGVVSGIVLTPAGSVPDIDSDIWRQAPSFEPIHNRDNDDPAFMYPDWSAEGGFDPTDVHISNNLFFHTLISCMDCRDLGPALVPFAAHEYLHAWEGFPDLYDYDVFEDGRVDDVNCPIGAWDIMAGARGNGSFVHPIPILKEQTCTRWAKPIDLRSILTPGVEATLTLPPSEQFRDGYFFLENAQRPGERYYLWSAGYTGFGANLPGAGMLILHTNRDANDEAVPLQQRTAPFNYQIVEADGLGDLVACSVSGNTGDAGDPWPGTTGNTTFNFDTNPPATWAAFNQWTGLDITNVVPDGSGSIALTLTWVPTEIPGLQFLTPPGGDSVGSIFQVRFRATDLFGGTRIRLYYTDDRKTCNGTGLEADVCTDHRDCDSGEVCEHDTSLTSSNVHFIAAKRKESAGTALTSMDWILDNVPGVGSVPDGRYVLFAKLEPGSGVDSGIERTNTEVQAARNNVGNGSLRIRNVSINSDANHEDDTARLETWTVTCIDTGAQTWRVNSSLTQPVLDQEAPDDDYPNAVTCPVGTGDCSPFAYTSRGNEVRFQIEEGAEPFVKGDVFTFTTTGITAVSSGVSVFESLISENPRPRIIANPLAGRPPLQVAFDGSSSSDPNGEPLTFRWTFGDGSPVATGATALHEYRDVGTFSVVLRATNLRTQRFGETAVDITVINNSPIADFIVTPLSGRAPLIVALDASGSSDSETTNPLDLVYQWVFGDGTTGNILGLPGLLRQTSHTYSFGPGARACTANDPCNFQITLDVTDADGGTSTFTREILVGNTIPVARVTLSPITGPAPLVVRFNAISSSDADPGDFLTATWDFDDGSALLTLPITGDAIGSNPGDGTVVHTYPQRGDFRPTAVISDGHPGGEAQWVSPSLITVGDVVAGSSNPRAILRLDPNPPEVGQEFLADASLSFDRPSGSPSDIASFVWDWGDGTAQGNGITSSHTYTEAGTYIIVLTVADGDTPPNTDSASEVVRVGTLGGGDEEVPVDRPPVGFLVITPPTGFVGEQFTFDASASSDPDGSDEALSFSWDFGDGSTGVGATTTHVYQAARRYIVRLTIEDEDGLTTQMTREVAVVSLGANLPPIASIAPGIRSGVAPLLITFDGRNSFDLDDDGPLNFLWEFRSNGQLIDLLTDPVVVKLFETPGDYTVELEVSDNDGGISRTPPEMIHVTASTIPPIDDGSGQPLPDDGDGEVPDSADQRPSRLFCGLGSSGASLVSLIGLLGLRVSRRRGRRP